jgi:hypothetical protein
MTLIADSPATLFAALDCGETLLKPQADKAADRHLPMTE